MEFFLGAPHARHFAQTDVPLMVSHRTLRDRVTFPEAQGPWFLDSGGFTELSMYGEWRTTPAEYIQAVLRYDQSIGRMKWAAPQDWMCEPFMLQKTGRTIRQHQASTVKNYLFLRDHSDLPFIPVIQGWELDDYLRCVDMYSRAGVDLTAEPLVGVGSVCRRQHTDEIGEIVKALCNGRIALHGFGVKMAGLQKYSQYLASADSMAWSKRAWRLGVPLPGCTAHKNCANCMLFALQWRDKLLSRITPLPASHG